MLIWQADARPVIFSPSKLAWWDRVENSVCITLREIELPITADRAGRQPVTLSHCCSLSGSPPKKSERLHENKRIFPDDGCCVSIKPSSCLTPSRSVKCFKSTLFWPLTCVLPPACTYRNSRSDAKSGLDPKILMVMLASTHSLKGSLSSNKPHNLPPFGPGPRLSCAQPQGNTNWNLTRKHLNVCFCSMTGAQPDFNHECQNGLWASLPWHCGRWWLRFHPPGNVFLWNGSQKDP